MKLLVRCGEKLSKLLKPHELERIYADAAEYTKEGVPVAEAEKRAVHDNLADIEENIKSAHAQVAKVNPELLKHAQKLTGDYHETAPDRQVAAPAETGPHPGQPQEAPPVHPPEPINAGLAPEPQRAQSGGHTPESVIAAVNDEIQKSGGKENWIVIRPVAADEVAKAGIAINRQSYDVIHDAPTLAKHAQAVDSAGGNGEKWVRAAAQEEAIHHADLLASGPSFDATHTAWWNNLVPEAIRQAVKHAYPVERDPAALMAELLRMQFQLAHYGHITEQQIPGHDIGDIIEKIRNWDIPSRIRQHLIAMDSPADAVAQKPVDENSHGGNPETVQSKSTPVRGPPAKLYDNFSVSAEPKPEDVAGAKLRDFLGRLAQKSEDEANGQAVLEDMEENGVSPQRVVQKFWQDTYGNLPDAVQKRFRGMIKSVTGLQVGDVVATQKMPNGSTQEITARDWEDVFPPDATSTKASDLEGTERGLVVMMHLANQGVGNLKPAAPAEKQAKGKLLGAAKPEPREVDPLGFYSHLAETVKQKVPNNASVQQIVSTLKSAGVKAQEVEWTGLNEFLRTYDGPVDKAKLLDFIRDGGIQLHEVQRQDTSDGTQETRKLIEAGLEPSLAAHAAQAALTGNEETAAKISAEYPAAKPILDSAMEVGSKEVKFSRYALPGGKNYKEVLLTLPGRAAPERKSFNVSQIENGRWEVTDSNGRLIARNDSQDAANKIAEEYRIRADQERVSANVKNRETAFQSNHWEEENVLAHIRQADHVDAQGRPVRLIEEIQSDWHQKGRKEGYAPRDVSARRIELQQGLNAIIKANADQVSTRGIAGLLDHLYDTDPEYRKLREELDGLSSQSRVPDAPFKKSWAELAFKRALAMAVEDKMKVVAWVGGQDQADRYSLSNQVSEVRYTGQPGQERLYAYDHRGREVLNQQVPESGLADMIGKEASEKLVAQPVKDGTRSLKGLELKVGGEGMKGFYDKILPDFVRNYVKKWGGQVSTTHIPEARQRYSQWIESQNINTDTPAGFAKAKELYAEVAKGPEVHSVEITPAMEAAVRQGQAIGALSPSAAAAASAKAAGKGAAASRGDERAAAKASQENRVQAATSILNQINSTLGRIKAAFTELPKVTDYRALKGEWLGTGQMGEVGSTGRQLASIESKSLRNEIKKQFPNRLSRMAISRYIEADGDVTALKSQAASSKPALAKVYERAANLTPAEVQMADAARKFFDHVGAEAVRTGLLSDMMEDYVTHFVDRSSIPANQQATTTQRVMGDMVMGKLSPDFKQARARVFRTMFDLEQEGYRLESSDIAEVMAAYGQSFANTLADRVFVKSLTQAKASDGRPLAVTSGSAKQIDPETATPLMVKPWTKPEEAQDYQSVNHPALRKWKWIAKDDDGKEAFVQGEMIVHPEIAQDLKNTLGRSKLNDVPLIRGITFLQGLAKQSMLGWSLFHYVQEGTHAIGHRVNPFKLYHVDPNDPVTRELINAGLFLSSDDARSAFGEGLTGGTLIDKIPGIGPINKALSDFLFEDYIPGLKVAMAQHAFERNLSRFKGEMDSVKITRAQVAQLTARQANDAFGEQNNMYEGTSPTQRHAERLAFLAPDFLRSRAQFVANAFTKYGTEQRQALLMLALVMLATAKVIERMLTGKNDWSKPFTVVTPHREYELRSVPGDVLEMLQSPRRFINGRLSPLISRPLLEAITGKDYRGRSRNFNEQLMDIVKTPIPISLRAFTDKDAPELSPAEQVGSAVGFRARRHSVVTDARILGNAWQEKQGKQPDETVYPPSKYLGIRQALEDSNLAKARTGYYNLLRTMTREQINHGFTESMMHPFSGSAKTEPAFVQSLHGDDLRTYYAATAERNRIMGLFQQISGYRGPARNPMFAKTPPPVFTNH